jgi:predicted component of type VI protein secretion system
MPILTLKFQDKSLGEYDLEPRKPLSIGRMDDNDIVIDNLAVSGHHAKIDMAGTDYILMDLQSKNKCFVNEEMVTSHKLRHGDVITIGKHQLTFAYKDDEEKPKKSGEDLYQTMVIDTSQHREMMKKSKQPTADADQPPAATLSLLSGGQGEIAISKKLFKIGKNPKSDYQIDGFWMGQTAITISQRPDGYYLSYVEGMSKPKVNGEIIKTTVRLKEFDTIELSRVKMQLVFKTPKKK